MLLSRGRKLPSGLGAFEIGVLRCDVKSTKFLIQEDKVILRALDVLDAMSTSIDSEGKVDESDVDKLLDFLRWFGDAHHQAKEETILFPALMAAAAAEARPVQHMTLEHEQERTN